MLVVLVIVGGLVYVLMRVLNPNTTGSSSASHNSWGTITKIFTARNIVLDGTAIESADVTEQFEPTDNPIYICYDLTVSEPVTMTYRWYHEAEFIFKDGAQVKSGTQCTGMTFTEPKILPTGNYHVDFFVNGIPTAVRVEFQVVGKTG